MNENGGAYSGLIGTCVSSTECSDRAGEKKGSCGSGFGVCCVKSLKACGGDVSHVRGDPKKSGLAFDCLSLLVE